MAQAEFQKKFGAEVVIFDGPTGTMLNAPSPEQLVLTQTGRKQLLALYAAYLAAGSRVLSTNTFAANRLKLSDPASVGEIIRSAVAVAREAAQNFTPDAVAIAGSVGPLDLVGAADASELEAVYREQIGALAAEKVDFLLLETFAAPREARAAIRMAHSSGVPFLFSLNANRFMSKSARRLAWELAAYAQEHGAFALGFNCAAPYVLTELSEELPESITLPLLLYPNAGTPRVDRGVVRYRPDTDALLTEASRWVKNGVAALGGCCGTTPEQIQALARNFAGTPVAKRSGAAPKPGQQRIEPLKNANALQMAFANHTKRIALELRFPADSDHRPTLEFAAKMADNPAVFFTIPDCPTGNPGCDPLAAAALLRHATGGNAEIMIHQAASNANLSKLYASIFGAWNLGVRGVLAVSGDPPALGPFNRLSHRVTDMGDSVGLLNLLRLLAEGWLLNDQSLRQTLPFVRGCAFAGGVHAGAAQWLKAKIAAGAQAIFTQPIFSLTQLEELIAEVDPVREEAQLFVGVLPIGSQKSAKRLQSGMIPGVKVPDEIVERFSGVDEARQVAIGVELAQNLAQAALDRGHNLYLIPPFVKNKYDLTCRLLQTLKF